MKNNLPLFALLLCLTATRLPAQQNAQKPQTPAPAVSDREFFTLQNDFNRLKTDYDRLADRLENKDKEWQSLNEEFKSLKSQINTYATIFIVIVALLGSITLWQVFKYSEEFLKKRFRAQIAETLETERAKILQLVASQDFENRVRENSRVLLISPNQAESDTVVAMLQNFGFKHIEPRFHDESQTSIAGFDLVVLNNPADEFAKNLLQSTGEKDFIVAFTKGRLTPHERLNFSNSPMTLYARVMETLKFKSLG